MNSKEAALKRQAVLRDGSVVYAHSNGEPMAYKNPSLCRDRVQFLQDRGIKAFCLVLDGMNYAAFERDEVRAPGTYEYWEKNVRSYWATKDEDAIKEVTTALVEADESGEPSCVMHEVYQYVSRQPAPTCNLCGSRGGLNENGNHNLCEEYKKRNMPTPPLPEKGCPCAKCEREQS
jgi:hypothetical protein